MEKINEIKLSAVVVTFYPQISDSILNIKQYIDYVDKLIIWENTPINDRESYKILLPEYTDKIIYLGTDKNEGIAYALNRSVEWSIKNKFTHILTMDQDSYWINFKHYRHKIVEYGVDTSIGVFGPNVYTTRRRSDLPEFNVVKDLITSGAVFYLEIFPKIGMFREDYFVEAVDLEFCYWAQRNGVKVVILGDCYLKQKYGDSTIHQFLNKSISTYNYSSYRSFNIVRNHIILWREYPELSKKQKKNILTEYTTFRILIILFYESHKIQKILSIFRGIIYGLLHSGGNPRNKLLRYPNYK